MYKNKINKVLNNSQEVYSTLNKERNITYNNININEKINNIFNSSTYVYKARITLLTETGTIDKVIVARNSNNLITIDGEYIPISSIKDIYQN